MDKSVAIFWDYENCHAPSAVSGYELASSIRAVAHEYGRVKLFKAYLALPEQSSPRTTSLRSELQSSGVSLTDCPHNGKKNVSDLMIVVELMAFAIDHPAPYTFVLITGDRDFSFAAATLRLRGYDIVLISPTASHVSLKAQATVCLDWNSDVMSKVKTTVDLTSPSPSPPISPGLRGRSAGSDDVRKSIGVQHETPNRSPPPPPPPSFIPARPWAQQLASRLAGTLEERPFLPKRESSTTAPSPASTSTTAVNLTLDTWKPLKEFVPQQQKPPFPTLLRLLNTSRDQVWKYKESYPDADLAIAPPPSLDTPPSSESPSMSSVSLPPVGMSCVTETTGSMCGDKIPVEFLPLARVLEGYRLSGIYYPLRTIVATDLARDHKFWSALPENKPFKKYARLAEDAGIICVGGDGDGQWIALHPEWHGKI